MRIVTYGIGYMKGYDDGSERGRMGADAIEAFVTSIRERDDD
jgi:hypothetical protein